jgi:hypothetical protein
MKKSSAFALAHAILFFAVAAFFAPSPSAFAKNPQAAAPESNDSQHALYGTIRSIDGSTLTIETRAKKVVQVKIKSAVEAQRSAVLIVGRAVLIHGTYDAKGTFQASAVQRAKSSQALWPEDK